MKINKYTLILAFALALSLCGCASSDTVSTALKTNSETITSETAIQETENSTEEVSETATSETDNSTSDVETSNGEEIAENTSVTESSAEEISEKVYFANGVYAMQNYGKSVDRCYYCFYDAENGRIANLDGSGIPFTCEQRSDGQIIFHTGSVDVNITMNVSTDENGTLCGTIDGETYSFTLVEYADPQNFDPTSLPKAQN